MTRKLIVTIDDEETSDLQASYYVMKVIQEGLLSETNKQKHYCFVTEFKNGGPSREWCYSQRKFHIQSDEK